MNKRNTLPSSLHSDLYRVDTLRYLLQSFPYDGQLLLSVYSVLLLVYVTSLIEDS